MSRREFVRQTSDALDKCAAYITENKDDLLRQISGGDFGCKSWSLEFRAGEDGSFPWVEVRLKCDKVDVLRAYRHSAGDYIISDTDKSPVERL